MTTYEKRIESVQQKIRAHLLAHGWDTRAQIADGLGLDELDVDLATQDWDDVREGIRQDSYGVSVIWLAREEG